MYLRPLIIAALMFLSLGAEAGNALLGCGSGSCCDPSPAQQCPPSVVQLGCDQICASQADAGVALAVEHEQFKPQPVPVDPFPAALQTYVWILLASPDVSRVQKQEAEGAVPHPPSIPTYLATARLRL